MPFHVSSGFFLSEKWTFAVSQFLAIMNNFSMNIALHVLYRRVLLLLLAVFPGLPGH